MGIIKNKMIEHQERGYGVSDKCICANCIHDKYLTNLIRKNGGKGACDFCEDKETYILPFETLVEKMMPAIECYYPPANEFLYYGEDGGYEGNTIDHYDFINDVLAELLQIEDKGVLDEFEKVINEEVRFFKYDYEESLTDELLGKWNEFVSLVNEHNICAEPLIALCKRSDVPQYIKDINAILQEIEKYAREMHAINYIEKDTCFYRCVNDIEADKNGYEEFSFIPANRIGTAPAKYVNSGRFNEKGDMMFYGASDKRISMAEVGAHTSNPFTMGSFFNDRRMTILNLYKIEEAVQPSIFDLENADSLQIYIFLQKFLKIISQRIPETTTKNERDRIYRATQVLTKYFQRCNSPVHGICYKSSKSSDVTESDDSSCYVLFVTNKNCLNEGDEYNKKSSSPRLIMKQVERISTNNDNE